MRAHRSPLRVLLFCRRGSGEAQRIRRRAIALRHGFFWTGLRPSASVETWATIVGGKLATGGLARPRHRADNPIDFVSAQDVAGLEERAINDPALRGRSIDVAGLDNLTLVQSAQFLGASRIRHVLRTALRCLSTLL